MTAKTMTVGLTPPFLGFTAGGTPGTTGAAGEPGTAGATAGGVEATGATGTGEGAGVGVIPSSGGGVFGSGIVSKCSIAPYWERKGSSAPEKMVAKIPSSGYSIWFGMGAATFALARF